MSERLVLALDQGTTNTKAIVIDANGSVRATASERVPLEFPRPGWAQSDPRAMWDGAERVIAACLDALDAGAVDTIALANQRETVVLWDRATGEPIGPAISWQCTRGAARCDALTTDASIALVAQRTGLQLDPMFSASKLSWLLDSVPDARRRAAAGELCAGTVDSWLLWRLTGTHATDHTNASRTLLCALDTGDWDPDLLALFEIDRSLLPDVHPSGDAYGPCLLRHARLSRDGAMVAAVLGDSHAALLGHGALYPGTVKASFGTGTSVMAPVGGIERVPELSSTVAWSRRNGHRVDVVHAVEGNIYATGSALEWTADLLGLHGDVAALEALASSAARTDGVMFVPAFAGLGAPHWDSAARGTIVGLTRHTGPAEVARAAFEAVAHQVADVIDELRRVPGCAPEIIRADGGAIRSELLAATVADLVGIPLECSEQTELAAVGAANLGGLMTGIWTSIDEVLALPHPRHRVEPTMTTQQREAERARWRGALQQTMGREP